MGTINIEVKTKRADWATPEVMLTMKNAGKTLDEISGMAGITKQRVSQLLKKERERQASIQPL